MEYPATDESREIGKDAEKIFESFLDSGMWNDSRIHREDDFGLDYRIEAIYNRRVVGYEFYVQLKGTTREPITSDDELVFPVQLKTSTVRYWKNKFPPIMIVVVDCNKRSVYYEWFDRNLVLASDQEFITIRVPATRLLDDGSIQLYLGQYYGSFRVVLDDRIKSNFVKRFLKDIASLSSILHMTVGQLLFKPKFENQEEASEYVDKLLNLFLLIFGRFIYDLEIYSRGVAFDGHPIMQALGEHVERIREINKKVFCIFGATPGWQMALTNHDALLKYMPTLVYTTTQIMEFFVGIVYGEDNEDYST